jgi:hypothetical protein
MKSVRRPRQVEVLVQCRALVLAAKNAAPLQLGNETLNKCGQLIMLRAVILVLEYQVRAFFDYSHANRIQIAAPALDGNSAVIVQRCWHLPLG